MQSIHCINTLKKSLANYPPFSSKKILYNRLLFWRFFFTFAPSEIENRNYE